MTNNLSVFIILGNTKMTMQALEVTWTLQDAGRDVENSNISLSLSLLQSRKEQEDSCSPSLGSLSHSWNCTDMFCLLEH